MAAPSVTYTFVDATTASASEVNTNFTDIINALTDGTSDLTFNNLTAQGTIALNGNMTFGNATGDTITYTGRVASHIDPSSAATYDLGDTTQTWRAIYLDNTSTDGGAIYFDAGNTDFLKASADGTILNIGGFTNLTFGTAGNINGIDHIYGAGNAAGDCTYSFTGDGDTGMYSTGADTLAFATNGQGRIFINSDGDVGIGTSSPTYAVDIEAPTSNDWVCSVVNSSATGPQALFVSTPNAASSNKLFNCSSTTNDLFGVTGTGILNGFITNWGSSATQDVGFSVTTGNGLFHKYTSSRRFKRNIRDLSFDTSPVYRLIPKQFQRIENGAHEFGLIAEEVAEFFPMLTCYETQHVRNAEGEITSQVEFILDENGDKIPCSVDYKLLSVLLLNELKKLKTRIEALEP
jgi:hypothetical protein